MSTTSSEPNDQRSTWTTGWETKGSNILPWPGWSRLAGNEFPHWDSLLFRWARVKVGRLSNKADSLHGCNMGSLCSQTLRRWEELVCVLVKELIKAGRSYNGDWWLRLETGWLWIFPHIKSLVGFFQTRRVERTKNASKCLHLARAVCHVPSECQSLLQKLLWPVVSGDVLGGSATKLLSKWVSTGSVSISAFKDARHHKGALWWPSLWPHKNSSSLHPHFMYGLFSSFTVCLIN